MKYYSYKLNYCLDYFEKKDSKKMNRDNVINLYIEESRDRRFNKYITTFFVIVFIYCLPP